MQRKLVLAQIDPVASFELICQMLDDLVVKILTTKKGVAIGRLHLKYAISNLKDRHVKRTTTEIVNNNLAGFAPVKTIGKRRCGGLVDDPQHFQPGNLAGILCGLPLRVIEVGRYSNNRLSHCFAKKRLCILFQLAQNKAGDLAW